MKKLLVFTLTVFIFSAFTAKATAQNKENEKITAMLDSWHKAAAEGDAATYFGTFTDDAIFIGTDPTEYWNKTEFQAFAKPYFDKGKAWDFKAIERHIYIDKSGKMAWFDELLDTWMKACRGSGVLVKVNGEWKIKHYVLSMTIPNDNTTEVIKIIAPYEDAFIKKLQGK